MAANENEAPMFELNIEGHKRLVHPEEVSAIVLRNLKESAETFVKQTVTYLK